ncbi:MAG: NosD domain-containing protein [Thermoplasmatota archaeon]
MDRRSLSLVCSAFIILASFVQILGSSDGDLIDEGSLVARDNIFIWDNSDFTSENGVSDGSGTPGDPYIIENWTIDHGNAGQIIIADTDSYVNVRNCRVWGDPNSGPGINIINASNIHIINCSLEDLDLGIWIQGGSSSVTIENTFFNNTEDGLRVYGSKNIHVINNFFLFNENSIDFDERVNSSEVFNNTIVGSWYFSIRITEGSENNHIHNNTIYRETEEYPYPENRDYHYGTGVKVVKSDHNIIENNIISNQSTGIAIHVSSDNRVRQNRFHNDPFNVTKGPKIGISIQESPFSQISGNRLINSGVAVRGSILADVTSIRIDETNTVDGKPVKFIKNATSGPDLSGDYGQIIFANCSGFDVRSLTMRSSGILLFFTFCSEISVVHNRLMDAMAGIDIIDSENISVKNNVIERSFYGITSVESSNITISSNNIVSSEQGIISASRGIMIDNNTISRTRTGIRLLGDGGWIVDNTIENGSRAVELRGTNTTVIRNSIISQDEIGIFSADPFYFDPVEDYPGPTKHSILENQIINCSTGIEIETEKNTVVGNTVKYCSGGISVGSAWNNLTGNYIINNLEIGILTSAKDNDLIGNEIRGNYIGIQLEGNAKGNQIRENDILRNDLGIHLIDEVWENQIIRNNISLNFRFAIIIDDDATINEIFWNRFYGNGRSGVQAMDNVTGNVWDDGIRQGNYWDDYASVYVPPAVNDGTVWNISYALAGSGSAEDRYPLVYPGGQTYKALKLIPPGIPGARVNASFEVRFSYKSAGISDDDIEFSLKTNASWLSLYQNGVLNGTPGPGDAGSYWVNVSITGDNLIDWVNFTVSVSDPLVKPWIKTRNKLSVLQGMSYYVDYEAGGNGSFSWTLTTTAEFLSINSTTGELSGRPANEDVGTHWVNVSLFEGDSLADYTNFTLTVENVNDPPTGGVINFGSLELKEGGPQMLSVSFDDPDKEFGDRFNITWTILGIGIVGYGEYVNLSLSAGNYSLSVKITDGNGSYIYVNTTLIVKSGALPDEHDDDDLWKYLLLLLVPLVILSLGAVLVVIRRRKPEEEPAPIGGFGYEPPAGGKGRLEGMIEQDLISEGNLMGPPIRDDPVEIGSDELSSTSGFTGSMIIMEDLMDEALAFDGSGLPADEYLEEGLQIKYSEGDITREEFEGIISILRGEE